MLGREERHLRRGLCKFSLYPKNWCCGCVLTVDTERRMRSVLGSSTFLENVDSMAYLCWCNVGGYTASCQLSFGYKVLWPLVHPITRLGGQSRCCHTCGRLEFAPFLDEGNSIL